MVRTLECGLQAQSGPASRSRKGPEKVSDNTEQHQVLYIYAPNSISNEQYYLELMIKTQYLNFQINLDATRKS